jgi:hypothetical protein
MHIYFLTGRMNLFCTRCLLECLKALLYFRLTLLLDISSEDNIFACWGGDLFDNIGHHNMWQVSTGLNLPQYPFLYHWQIRFTLPCIVLYSVYIAEWWASTCLLSVYAKDTIIWTDMQFLFSSSMLHTRSLNSQIYVVIFEFVPCSCHIYGWRLERGINLTCIYSHLMFRWI